MFQKVLVPLDGSEVAAGILAYVSQLAQGLKSHVVLMTAVDPQSLEIPRALLRGKRQSGGLEWWASSPGSHKAAPTPGARVPYVTEEFKRTEQEARGRLAGALQRLSEEGLSVESVVGFGPPAEEIVRIAEAHGCDCIAMSTRGRDVMGRGILGSVADKVVHSSQLPVLTITPEKAEQYESEGKIISRIIAPSDGSPLAESALPYVEHLARELSLEVVLTRAVDLSRGDAYLSDFWNLGSEVEADAAEYLKRAADRTRQKGLDVQWRLLRGRPAREIVNLARDIPQCMIALSTHGRSGLTRWVLGSVAEAVVRASGHPVLIIPPGQAQEESMA